MKKIATLVLALSMVHSIQADLTWQSEDNLLGNIVDITFPGSGGWLVQMYRDLGNDTDLSAVTFGLDGTPTGTGNSTGDELLASFSTSLNAYEFFGENVDFTFVGPYNAIQGFNVYTVILDTDSWANATTANRTLVLDEVTYFINDGDPSIPIAYNVPNDNPNNNEWQQVIPEPGTMAMLLLGMTGLFGLRRKLIA